MATAKILPFFLLSLFITQLATTFSQNPPHQPSNSTQINSNSVLVALLDSHYTQLAELIEKALLLQTLEHAVNNYNITIFAPRNEALEQDLDPEFKRFLLEPGNVKSLQNLLLHHFLPVKLTGNELSSKLAESTRHKSLCDDFLQLSSFSNGDMYIGNVKIVHPNSISRPDGVIHGIQKAIIPKSVQQDFNARRSLRSISAVKPESAPEIDPRTLKFKTQSKKLTKPAIKPPVFSIFEALAPGPSLAPAPAPGPGGPHHHFNGQTQVDDFIKTLLHYGGYNEMADILVNLTSLASEMGKLVSEGYKITVLAPNDEAMAKLTTEQLSEPGAPEQIVYYHIVPEYQTEESMYNAVRRFGKVNYDTLRVPEKLVAEEADGSVKFGGGEEGAYLFDPDIYTDGRISVQGIDGVLFPPEKKKRRQIMAVNGNVAVMSKPRRGKLLGVACRMLGALGQDSLLTSCH
nr:fasciclin-like arabinogalactan protein 8 [Centaurium erythraea]